MAQDVTEFVDIVNGHPGHTALGLRVAELGDGSCFLDWSPTQAAMTPFGHLYSGAMAWALDAAANNALFSAL